MRKRISWLVVVVLIIALLPVTGCGKKSTDGSADAGTPGTPTAPVTPTNPDNEISALMQKGAAAKNMSFEGTLGSADASYTAKGWVLGSKTRIERTVGDETTIVIYDDDSKLSWTWVKGTANGFKGEIPAMVFESPVFWAQTLQGVPWKKADSGEVNGVKCRIVGFAYGNPQGNVDTTLWVAEDSGLPLKMEAAWNGVKMAFEYKSVTLTAPAADLFVPPTDVKFMEIPK